MPKHNVIKDYKDPYAGERGGLSQLTKQHPKLSGFLQGLVGQAPDEMGSVLDPLTAEQRKGAEYGFPIGTIAGMLPFGGGIAAAPKAVGMSQRGVVKMPGGQWLKGSVEDSLKGLKLPEGNMARQMEAVHGQRIAPIPEADQADALNSWIDKQLTRYIKNDMATERDPIRALAERGTLHADMGPFGPVAGETVSKLRSDAGLPVGGSGTSDLAKTWENVSDAMMRQTPMAEYQNFGSSNLTATEPWLQKLDPNTLMYRVKDNAMSSNLGFDHLIDELRNATDPASGLPPELLLKYDSLPQVSVPQAVERVAKINAWREAKALEAKKALAEGIPVMKEYPEGYKWLSVPDVGTDEKALKYAVDTGCEGGWCTQGPETAKRYGAGKGGRLHILQGPDGSAHVQIHTTNGIQAPEGTVSWSELSPDWQANLTERGLAPKEGADLITRFDPTTGKQYLQLDPQITQIKGKSNLKPHDKYLPFVQDFVKSGKWVGVDDLQNTGLYTSRNSADAARALGKDYTPEIAARLEKLHPSKYLTVDDLRALGDQSNPFWYNPEGSRMARFPVETSHTANIMDPVYAEQLGVPALSTHGDNAAHMPLLMGRTRKTNPEVLDLMQVGNPDEVKLSNLKGLLSRDDLPHKTIDFSAGESLFEGLPIDHVRNAETLEDLAPFKKYAAGGVVTPAQTGYNPAYVDQLANTLREELYAY